MTGSKRFLSYIMTLSLLLGTTSFGAAGTAAQTPRPAGSTSDQQAMDKLLAPIALYPDALLAQVLAAASSPEQVTEVNKWLQQNSQVQGTDLQQAAEQAGFDAAFVALVLFPDVLNLMQQNLDWTTELGKAFTSDQMGVLDSVQRLRAQAQAVGNLKTTPQQEVTTETQSGQQVIVIQPANPQIVYVPQYNPQVVYAAPPPSSGDVAAAAVIGFGLGIALGVAMSNSYYGYYGWGAWGMHWNTRVVVVHGGAWRVPPYHRYPYARPVPYYRPNVNVYAPRYSSVNVNVNNVNVNRNNVNVNNNYGRTPRPTTLPAASSPTRANTTSATTMPNRGNVASNPASPSRGGNNSTPYTPNRANNTSTAASPTRSNATRPPTTAANSNDVSRGRAQSYSGASQSKGASGNATPARQMEKGAPTSAFSGYQKGSGAQAASARGRSSTANAAASRGGGGRGSN